MFADARGPIPGSRICQVFELVSYPSGFKYQTHPERIQAKRDVVRDVARPMIEEIMTQCRKGSSQRIAFCESNRLENLRRTAAAAICTVDGVQLETSPQNGKCSVQCRLERRDKRWPLPHCHSAEETDVLSPCLASLSGTRTPIQRRSGGMISTVTFVTPRRPAKYRFDGRGEAIPGLSSPQYN